VLPPGTMMLPVGGIDASNIAPWRAAGAAGFGIGSAIYKPGDTPDTVSAKTRALLAGG
jgi:2-dehydro-3-deoxyphosphogalactonate aldolase